MKSPHTLIKLHERAIRYQEMIKACDHFMYSNLNDANLFKQKRKIGLPHPSISKRIRAAWRYRRIRFYLITRYDNLIKKL